MEVVRGTTNTDPFAYGITNLYDGMETENFFVNYFRGPDRRVRQTGQSTPIINEVLEYIKTYGVVKSKNLSKRFGMKLDTIKFLITYRDNIYESDDGRWIGVLDDKGDPYPAKPEPKVERIDTMCKIFVQVIVDGEEKIFNRIKEAADYLGVSNKVVSRKIHGQEPKILNGVTIKWVKRHHDKKQ